MKLCVDVAAAFVSSAGSARLTVQKQVPGTISEIPGLYLPSTAVIEFIKLNRSN